MLQAWRIVRKERQATAFSGEGAWRFGGRWNSPGHSVVYTSESKAVAALEILVHLRPNELKMEFVIFEVVFAFTVATLSHLPPDWKEEPAPPSTQALGDEWIEAGTSAVLKVPSVLTEEGDFLFSPAHSDFNAVTNRQPRAVHL